MNAESPPSSGNQGKWIRFALVAFPVGLIVLGAASFWIYFEKKEREEKHTYRHALALRHDVSEADLSRYLQILGDAAKESPDERRLTIASFVESTLGSENMGYDLKRDVELDRGVERVSFHASLDGTRRPNDVVLVVVGYANGQEKDEAALAGLFSVAQAMTGSPRVKTVRFAVLDTSVGSIQPALERLEYDMRKSRERMVHLIALGPSARAIAEERSRQPGGGVVTIRPFAIVKPEELKPEAEALQKLIIDAADRL